MNQITQPAALDMLSSYAERATRSAELAELTARFIVQRPIFRTRAEAEMEKAEAKLRGAADHIKRLRKSYSKIPQGA